MSSEWAVDDPRRGRVMLRKELIEAGLDDRSIRARVQAGELARIRWGAYVDGTTWSSCDAVGRHGLVCRAVLKQANADVVLSHVSALGEWDIPLWDTHLDEVHLTRVDGRAGRRAAGVCQHLGELREGDAVERNGIVVTSPTRTALDALTVLDVEHGLTVVNHLLHRRMTTLDDLEAGRVFMERWPNTLRHRAVLGHANPQCESIGETRTGFLCWQQGLPRPQAQFVIRDPATGAFVARVDFAWPEHGVFLEFDGRVKYQALLQEGESTTDVVLREKRREQQIVELTGWRCIRITWADLYAPEQTAARIRALLFPSGVKAS